MRIERGDIWWVNLDPTVGREIKKKRPCVVLSANEINSIRATPIVVPLSSSPEIAPPVVLAVPSAGRRSVAVIDQLRAVAKKRFINQAGAVSPADLKAIESAVKQILALS
ncbi:MAG TPA: type II toxin-antitoxin system PemK/MazF family toxin [Verrucomicrobiae bacterium]|jgi:mRNA interferase MazF|nr:type II toxin-antitoxin system PemK/MazF family toxin [Verrucomicrobiae bacterium]